MIPNDKQHATSPAENLMILRARLWEHLSVAERRELSDAANILKPANTDSSFGDGESGFVAWDHETVKQEIRDLFARYGSGNYTPTEEEKAIIETGLDEILTMPPAPLSATARPAVVARRPFNDDQPDGLLESDRDYVLNNIEAAIQLLDAAQPEAEEHWVFAAAEQHRPLADRVQIGASPWMRRHLHYMLDEIARRDMSPTKACRWLGWVQACICFGGVAPLEDLKAINKAASDTQSPQREHPKG